MKRVMLIIAAATLGLSAPAPASAQKLRDLLNQAMLAEQDRGGGRDRDDDRRRPRDDPRPAAPQAREISMSQAIRIVEQAAPQGRHLDARREDRGGRPVYRIQWQTNSGERRDYVVDAQTGALSR